MSAAAIGVSGAIDSALRRGFSEASVRLQPEAKISDIVTGLSTLGVTVTVEDGLLTLRQGDTEMVPAKALRTLTTKPEFQKFFVVDGQHPSTWSTRTKIEYLRTHSDDDFRRLIQAPVLEAGVRVLDPNMEKSAYLALTRKEKMQFISEYGDEAVRQIMRKVK